MLSTSNVSQQVHRRAMRVLKRGRLLAASMIVVLSCSSGCTILTNAQRAMRYNDSWNENVVSLRNRNWSAKAWHKRKQHFCHEKHISDFCAGFRQGYEDVAGGSDGCTPTHPPREYWSWQFQSAEGQARTAAWYAGYPQGARAAEEEGVGNYTQLQLSSGFHKEFQQAGVLPPGGVVYPIPETPMGHQPSVPMNTVPMQSIPREVLLPNIGEPTPVLMP